MYKTLILIDWDDTILPTTFLQQNNDASIFFPKLDILVSKLLSNMNKYGTIIIVTNASLVWIRSTLLFLPYTQEFIKKNNIKIISAKELYHQISPSMMDWKKLTFKQIVNKFYDKQNVIQNIISIGDAEYERNATINLYNKNNPKRILKTIKLLKDPSYDTLIDQLEVVNTSMDKIIKHPYHLDLIFFNK